MAQRDTGTVLPAATEPFDDALSSDDGLTPRSGSLDWELSMAIVTDLDVAGMHTRLCGGREEVMKVRSQYTRLLREMEGIPAAVDYTATGIGWANRAWEIQQKCLTVELAAYRRTRPEAPTWRVLLNPSPEGGAEPSANESHRHEKTAESISNPTLERIARASHRHLVAWVSEACPSGLDPIDWLVQPDQIGGTLSNLWDHLYDALEDSPQVSQSRRAWRQAGWYFPDTKSQGRAGAGLRGTLARCLNKDGKVGKPGKLA